MTDYLIPALIALIALPVLCALALAAGATVVAVVRLSWLVLLDGIKILKE